MDTGRKERGGQKVKMAPPQNGVKEGGRERGTAPLKAILKVVSRVKEERGNRMVRMKKKASWGRSERKKGVWDPSLGWYERIHTDSMWMNITMIIKLFVDPHVWGRR